MKRKLCIIASVILAFLLLSCKSRSAISLVLCNFSNSDCTVEILSDDYTFPIHIDARTVQFETLKARTAFRDLKIKLILNNKEIDSKSAKFPDGGITSDRCGTASRINIFDSGNGQPYLEITSDWEADPFPIGLNWKK